MNPASQSQIPASIKRGAGKWGIPTDHVPRGWHRCACDQRNRVDPQQRWQRGPPTGVSPPTINNAVTWYIHVSALRVSNH